MSTAELALTEAVPLAHAVVARTAELHDVRVLFIKGPVAARQGLRSERPSVDVDALVDPAHRHVLAAALTELGWVDENPYTSPTVLPQHSLTHRKPSWPCELDLHDRFPGFFADEQAVFDVLWARRQTIDLAGRQLPCPDDAGQVLILALHSLRDPHDPNKAAELANLQVRVSDRMDGVALLDLARLAFDLGAADTAAPFLRALGAPEVGVGTTSAENLRLWHIRTHPRDWTAVSWIAELRRRPVRSWPRFLWYAALLSDKELILADPSLPATRRALWRARVRRLRRGLTAVPSAIRSVRESERLAETPSHPGAAAPTNAVRTARVVVVQEILTGYRVPFFTGLREKLADAGVELTLVHGYPQGARASRRDQGDLPWAVTTANKHISLVPGMKRAVWQPLPRRLVREADLVVLEAANRQLVNYLLLVRYFIAGSPRVALWGHGGNLQSEGRLGAVAEHFKARISARPHWWLAYTEGAAERVASHGFSRDRVTVVQNSIAVASPASPPPRVNGQCVYIGSLYKYKRIDFLLQAGQRIAELRDDFKLVIVGDGEDRALVEEVASSEPWLEYRGVLRGEEAANVLRQSNLVLNPGMVGLAVVDSFANECPVVTVDHTFHSPEVEYLRDGVNGVCLPAETDANDYADAVAQLLADPVRVQALRGGCRDAAEVFTLSEMVDRFAEGLLQALS